MSGEDQVPVRDRTTIVTSVVLVLIAGVAWAAVVVSSSGSHAGMTMEAMAPTLSGALVFVGAWAVMMTAMMLPSALPMIALYGAIRRHNAGASPAGVPVAVFTLVYLGVWAATGLPVYGASAMLDSLAPPALPWSVAIVLVVAGVYQLSPLKQACLRACRSPLGFLLGHWRAGRGGSLALGWRHAAYCLGCCWALMLVLVAAGAMGLVWVLLVAAVVAAEKLLPGGPWFARAIGGALVVLGVLVALRPDLLTLLRGGHVL